jgi:protein TonB
VEVVTAPATAQPVRPLPQAAVPATLALAPTPARTYALPQTQQVEAATPPAAETLAPAEPEKTIAREVAAETVTAEIETEPLETVAPQEIRPASAAKAVTQTAPQTTSQAAAPTVEPTPVSETAPAEAQPVSQAVAQEVAQEVAAEVVTAEVEAEAVPTPMAKPPAPVRRKVEKKPAKSPARTAKNTETRKTASKVSSSSGSGGSAQVTAQKGGSQRKGKGKTAGNSDVTNYPAKVQRKLLRAVRKPRGVRKARGNVVVHFTVRKNGSVSGVKLARSSGSAPFDQAVLKAVQRASPFPPIPDAARKRSWTFTLPVGMR